MSYSFKADKLPPEITTSSWSDFVQTEEYEKNRPVEFVCTGTDSSSPSTSTSSSSTSSLNSTTTSRMSNEEDLNELCINENQTSALSSSEHQRSRSTTELFRDLYRLDLLSAPNLDDIEINLDLFRDFPGIPDKMRNLLVTVVRAGIARRYDIIPGSLLASLIKESDSVIPELRVGTKDQVYISHCELGPEKFFLQWKRQEDRLFLINRWLTDLIDFRKLTSVLTLNENLIGKLVAAPLPDSIADRSKDIQLFGRGFIKNVKYSVRKTEVEIFYMDYGFQAVLGLDDLWIIPYEIAEVRPLCFTAHLVHCESQIENSQLYNNAVNDFNRFVTECSPYWKLTVMNCQLRYIREGTERRHKSCGVQLWKPRSGNKSPSSEVLISVALDKHISENEGVQEKVEVQKENISDDTDFNTSALCPIPSEVEVALVQEIQIPAEQQPPIPSSVDPRRDLSLQLADQLYTNDEIDVKPYSEKDFRCLNKFKVLNIISPGEFQLEYISLDDRALAWWRTMQTECNTKEYQSKFAIRGSRVTKDRCYLWKDETSDSWNRVRMVEPAFKKGLTSKVWDLDRGRYAQVKFEDMLEIDPQYCALPALAFKAHLVHIKAFTFRRSREYWDKKFISYFTSICAGDKIFSGITLEKKECSINEKANYPNEFSYGVVLVEEMGKTGTVQAALVNSKMALPTGPSSGRFDLAYMLGEEPFYDRREIAPDLQLHLGQKVKKSKIKSANYKLYTGQNDTPQPIPDIIMHRMSSVFISCVGTGPGCFYIMMRNKVNEFNEMIHDLEIISNNLPPLHTKDVLPGMFVLATALDEENIPKCYRVVILYLTDHKKIKAALAACIDTGLEFLINLDTVRAMPPGIKLIPPFCHRVHLGVCLEDNQLIPAGVERWTKENNSTWRRFITAWQGPTPPSYYAWQPKSNILELEEFNQELFFNKHMKTWEPGKVRKSMMYSTININREHDLLKHFYSSIEISLVYESANEKFYDFIPFSDSLENIGCLVHQNKQGK